MLVRLVQTMTKWLFRAALASGMLLVLGFLAFAWSVARVEPEYLPRADGIVALTGGAHRLSDATALLSRGHARRMLVTGVNPATSRQDLARRLGSDAHLIECCVDLGYDALNTVGNAVETRKWVEENGFKSVIVVTSTYHMPRTLMELRRRIAGVELVPYPVVSGAVQVDRWWEHPSTLRLLAGEYAKFLFALTRPYEPEPPGMTSATMVRPTATSVSQ